MEQLIISVLFICFLASLRFFPGFWIAGFAILRRCWFPLFAALLVAFIYAGTAQGRSIVREIDFNNTAHRKYVTLFVLWLWSFNSFQLATAALDFMDLSRLCRENRRQIVSLKLLVPAFIGLLPFIVSITCFVLVREKVDPGLFWLLIIDLWFFIIFLLIWINNQTNAYLPSRLLHGSSLFLFYLLSKIDKRLSGAVAHSHANSQGEAIGLRQAVGVHWRRHATLLRALNWSMHLAAFLAVGLWPIYFSKFFGPIGLIFVAMSSFVVLGTCFIYLSQRTRFPVFPLLLLTILLFTAVSDNNKAGIITNNNKDQRKDLDPTFISWLEQQAGEDTARVTLVAAEGGGLRSAYWTYVTLRKLQERDPRFFKRLFAISCVSGGSVGSALFCSEHIEGYSKTVTEVPIINHDNLSPMIAALFFREIIQSLLPFDISSLDRSLVMDQTFELHWKERHPGSRLWESSFLNLWEHQQAPALLINSIHVESGASVLLSNLKFDSTVIQSTDILRYINETPSLSKAVGLSARFPYVQPAARFQLENGNTWGHLADGGYYENSGLATVYQLYLHLRKISDGLVKEKKVKAVRFSLLQISNGVGVNAEPAARFLNEMNAPLNTLLNSWYTRGYSYGHLARLSLERMGDKDRLFEIRLDRKKANNIPLGWFLSTESRREIIRQGNALTGNPEYQAYNESAY